MIKKILSVVAGLLLFMLVPIFIILLLVYVFFGLATLVSWIPGMTDIADSIGKSGVNIFRILLCWALVQLPYSVSRFIAANDRDEHGRYSDELPAPRSRGEAVWPIAQCLGISFVVALALSEAQSEMRLPWRLSDPGHPFSLRRLTELTILIGVPTIMGMYHGWDYKKRKLENARREP